MFLCSLAKQFSLALDYLFLPSGACHFDQQNGDVAQCTSDHRRILTPYSDGFHTRLILQKIKRPFAVFTNIMSQFYLLSFIGYLLE